MQRVIRSLIMLQRYSMCELADDKNHRTRHKVCYFCFIGNNGQNEKGQCRLMPLRARRRTRSGYI